MKKLNNLKGLSLAIALGLFSTSAMAQDFRKALDTKRFAQAVNTGENHTLLILDSSWGDTKPEIGDEIAAYDSQGNMVSSVVYVGEHTGLALWGDDEYTQEKEGLAKAEKFHLKWWKKAKNELVSLEVADFERGDDTYNKDKISVISDIKSKEVLTQDLELFQNVPNPVADHTEINFYLPQKKDVYLGVFNSLGQEVMVLANETFEAGSHKVEMIAPNLEAGIYFYNLVSGEEKLTKQMTVVK
ncbi:MAG: T9SS type A sorting domain-containing protein [Flavobacteriales bacterium]|nr:T9SS type A sorting domain-containing protein [Flavobacteriales bacterium]